MKTKTLISRMAVLGLSVGAATLSAFGQNFYPANPDTTGVAPVVLSSTTPVSQNFDSYLGTTATFTGTTPLGYYVESILPSQPFNGQNNGSSSTTGWWSYGTTSAVDRAFGIFEKGTGTGEFGDARLYLKFQNSTGAPLKRVVISYDIEEWRDGARTNSIRLKYNSSGTDGFSSVGDLAETVAPITTGGDAALDGNAAANKRTASVLVPLPAPIANGSKGYFRWQYSTFAGSGSRDGLAVDNVRIQALPSGTDQKWVGGTGSWTTAATNWPTGTWNNNGLSNAVFDNGTGTAGTVTHNFNVNAIDLAFNRSGYTIAPSGAVTIKVDGAVDFGTLSGSATINSVITGTAGLVKTGTGGTLILGGTNTYTGNTNIYGGTVKLTTNNAIPAASGVTVSNATTFDVNGKTDTIESLSGGGAVSFGTGTTTGNLTIASAGDSNFDGTLTGTGTQLVKSGSGTQTFKNVPKIYSATTIVNNGVLEVTDNGQLTKIPAIQVTGSGTVGGPQGTLLVTSDSNATTVPVQFGTAATIPVQVNLGYIEASNTGTFATQTIQLPNKVSLADDANPTDDFQNRISASGSNTKFSVTGAIINTGTLGSFRKNGAGELLLSSGSNVYSGSTEVNNGKVTIPATGSIGAGTVFISGTTGDRRVVEFQRSATIRNIEGNESDTVLLQTGTVNINANTLTLNRPAVFTGTNVPQDEDKNAFGNNLVGSGTLRKLGYGTTHFTVRKKNFTGAVVVDNGVLQVSNDGQFANVGTVSVNILSATESGQLRLSSGTSTPDTIAYNFGPSSSIVVSSTSRALGGGITANNGYGELGGIRFDPDDGPQYATLATNVQLTGTAGGDIHVNGIGKELKVSKTFSGTGKLTRTGGGKVVFGNSTVSGTAYTFTGTGFSGAIQLDNGATVVASTGTIGVTPASKTLTVGVGTSGTHAEFGGDGRVFRNVTVTADGALSQGELATGTVPSGTFLPVGALRIDGNLVLNTGSKWMVNNLTSGTAVTVSGDVTLPGAGGLTVDARNAGSVSGTHTIANVSGNINGAPVAVTIVNGGGVVSGTAADDSFGHLLLKLP